jgi:D-alanyl-D-alanine carboxypeptidase (penicillin-binding protein 5/6)
MADPKRLCRRFALGTLSCALALSVLLGAAALRNQAAAIESEAKQLVMIDVGTGSLLIEKNSDETMFPASMSKLMTLYIVFDHLASGRLSMEDTLPVSEKAWRMGGSKMFVEVGSRVSVQELLRGVIVQSGNDACIVLAEGLAGSEEAFAAIMNEKGSALGLTGSHFVNSTGWPHPEHVTTSRDLARLAEHMINDFPQYYPIFAEKNYTYNGIRQGNRNPLLYRYDGADGLKTGHTEASGYGLTASAKRGDRRLILVVNGLPSVNARSQESERLLDYGFREFKNYTLFKSGQVVDNFNVWLGDLEEVPLVVGEEVTLTMSRKGRAGMVVKIVADGPIRAPVEKGAEVAKLVVSGPDMPPREWALTAGASVDSLSGFGRIGAAIDHLLWGSAQ